MNGLPAVLAVPLIAAMQAGSLAAVFVAGGLAFAAGRRRLARELVVSGTLAWLAAKAARLIVHRGRPSALLAGVLIRGAKASGLGFASGHAAVAAALATAVAPYLGRRARRLVWCAVGIVGIARVYVGAHFPLDVVGGAALGWAIGSGVHLVWGPPGGRPDLDAVRQSLLRAGIEVRALYPLTATADARGSAPFLARDDAGAAFFVKVVGRAQRDADWVYRAWRYVAYREAGDEPPFPAPKQIIEHEALLCMLAARGGVRTPALVAVSALPDRSGMLVFECVPATPVGQAGAACDGVVHDIWRQVTRLRAARIAHRDLRRANILIDDADRPWIVDFGFGQTAASDRMLAQDVAELLASLAVVVGARRAVAGASAVLGAEDLHAALPLLQPLALSAATRRDLRAYPGLLAELRRGLVAILGLPAEPPPQQLLRIRPRAVLILVMATLAAHIIVPQVAELPQIGHVLRGTRWDWLAAAALASCFTYLAAALAIAAAAGRRLPIGRTILAQLRQVGRPGQDEPGQHIGLERGQLIRPGRNARLTQVSHDGQAQARASLAFTDPERPVTDTIDLQEARETITSQHSRRSRKDAQVQGLQKQLSPRELWGYFLEKGQYGTSLAAHPTARRVRRAAWGNGPRAIRHRAPGRLNQPAPSGMKTSPSLTWCYAHLVWPREDRFGAMFAPRLLVSRDLVAMTDGGAEKVLACSASSLPGAARAARDDATIATLVKAELPEADRVRWETYECRPSGSRLNRMAPRFDDGSLSVHVSAMYYWQDAAQAHRASEQDDIPVEVVLIVDDDLAATLEV